MADESIIEYLQRKPYWIVDVLPKQVPVGTGGQYFQLEKYFLSHPQIDVICGKFVGMLARVNCYMDLQVSRDGEGWATNPLPELLSGWFMESVAAHQPLFFLLDACKSLLEFSGDDHYLTLYSPSEELLGLVGQLAAAEGLFVWKPK